MKNEKTITLNLTEEQSKSLVKALLFYELECKKENCLCLNYLLLNKDRKTKDFIFQDIQIIRGALPESISLI